VLKLSQVGPKEKVFHGSSDTEDISQPPPGMSMAQPMITPSGIQMPQPHIPGITPGAAGPGISSRIHTPGLATTGIPCYPSSYPSHKDYSRPRTRSCHSPSPTWPAAYSYGWIFFWPPRAHAKTDPFGAPSVCWRTDSFRSTSGYSN
jgi:hypothetical protein